MEKKKYLKNKFHKSSFVAFFSSLFFLCCILAFFLCFLFLKKEMFLYLLFGVSFLYCLFLTFFFIYQNRKNERLEIDFFKVSYDNYDRILNRKNELSLYIAKDFEEVRELNSKIAKTNESLSHILILADKDDYSSIPLEYVSKEKKIVEHHTFHLYLDRIISDSCAYRNMLVQVYYEMDDNQKLWDYEKQNLFSSLNDVFKEYEGRLLSLNKKGDGIYLYLPKIDSINNVKERLNSLLIDGSIMRENLSGSLTHYPLHYAMVCYPYSNIDEMFSDIDFAKRMGKLSNCFFPVRTSDMLDINKFMRHEAMNLNYSTKLLSGFSSLSISKKEQVWKDVRRLLSEFIAYLGIEQAGIIDFEDASKQYQVFLEIGEQGFGFQEKEVLPFEFIKNIESIADDDKTYFASKRDFLSVEIAEVCDRNGIKACFYFLVYGDRGNLRAVIFFQNHQNDILLDTYLRETLLLASTRLGDIYLTRFRQQRLSEEERITSSLLKLSDYCMYKINPKTMQLTFFSSGVEDALHGKIAIGDCCYKVLYGKDSPCSKCPLFTGRKMKSTLEPWQIETSLTLNEGNGEGEEKILLIKRIKGNDVALDDPYDVNILVNSYYTLIQSLKNAYLLNGRGYVLLLKFDNQMELVAKFGSEPVSQAMRSFALKIRDFETISNVYFYKQDTLAILLSDYGQIDAVNECEAIYELNKTSFFDDKKTTFKITYLPISYPQGYPSYTDFLRHTENFYFSKRYQTGKDFIYFDESNYSRPASTTQFMLSVIDEKFTNKDFMVNLQPLINTSNRKIFGAELLLRLSDEYRKITFNTDQLIKVAAANGKINLISSALLDYVSDLYSQFGNSVFRIYGFTRLTINTDYSYLSDTTLSDQIEKLYEKNHLPKNFLGFEITEKEISEHYSDMKKFIAKNSNLGVLFLCDRYNGEYLTFDRLKELGISEIKIDREYTRFIDTDKAKYNMVRSLLESAKESSIRVGLIGVENMEQYKIIKSINPDCYLQGYAFFRPLERQALIDAIRKTNTVLRTSNK